MQRQANRTVYFGTESITSLAPKLWELIPSEIKIAKSLNIFKAKKKHGQQINVLVGFVKRMLETLVSFSGVLKDETLNPPSCHFIIFFFLEFCIATRCDRFVFSFLWRIFFFLLLVIL